MRFIPGPNGPRFASGHPVVRPSRARRPAYETGHKPAQRRVADFAETTAYVSPVTPIAQAPETDGLSRKDEECNFGCIDH